MIPYNLKDVLKAAKYLFDNQAFDLVQLRQGKVWVSWVDEMEEDDGEERERREETNIEEERKTVKKTRTGRGGDTKENLENLDVLIKRLSSLQVHETNYAVTYARLVLYHPTVTDRWRVPAAMQKGDSPEPMGATYMVEATGTGLCGFCKRRGCFTRTCEAAAQYMREGKIIKMGVWCKWLDNSRIPSHEKGEQLVIVLTCVTKLNKLGS
jgi:hypothetical protein